MNKPNLVWLTVNINSHPLLVPDDCSPAITYAFDWWGQQREAKIRKKHRLQLPQLRRLHFLRQEHDGQGEIDVQGSRPWNIKAPLDEHLDAERNRFHAREVGDFRRGRGNWNVQSWV